MKKQDPISDVTPSLLAKLGSIAVHAEEMVSSLFCQSQDRIVRFESIAQAFLPRK